LHPDPSLARAAFEEAVRYKQTFFRTTTRPVEIGGIAVDEAEKVLMFLGAANRDPGIGSARTTTTSPAASSGMSASVAASTNASVSCWRVSKANAPLRTGARSLKSRSPVPFADV
jgi:hypothetical protein